MSDDDLFWRALFWRQANEFRNWRRLPGALDLVRNALAHGQSLNWQTLAAISQYDEAAIVDPQVVATFAIAYTADRPPLRVLDPWAGLGVTLRALDDAGRLASGTAIEINEPVHGIARELSPDQRITWLLGDASKVLPQVDAPYELVVGSPPLGLPPAQLTSSHDGVDLRASATYTMLVQAATTLGHDGEMLVILPESFFGPANAKVRDALAAVDVYPAAALALPASAYSTTVARSLVVLTRTKRDVLFAAQLDAATDPAALVANLRQGRDSKLPQLGRLVAIPQFVSWQATLVADEVLSAARTMGLRSVGVTEILQQHPRSASA